MRKSVRPHRNTSTVIAKPDNTTFTNISTINVANKNTVNAVAAPYRMLQQCGPRNQVKLNAAGQRSSGPMSRPTPGIDSQAVIINHNNGNGCRGGGGGGNIITSSLLMRTTMISPLLPPSPLSQLSERKKTKNTTNNNASSSSFSSTNVAPCTNANASSLPSHLSLLRTTCVNADVFGNTRSSHTLRPASIQHHLQPQHQYQQHRLSNYEHTTNIINNRPAGLCGLRNIGNTCFMNSVLQCLCHTRELSEYLRNSSDSRSTTKDQRIFYEFAKLIREMLQPRQRSVTPSELKSAVSSKHRMYSGCAQQDAQEFLRFFLDSLHNASNKGVKGAKLELDESLPDQRQAEAMWRWYTSVENSVVQDLFVGQFKSSLRCTVCDNTSVTFDPFWDLRQV